MTDLKPCSPIDAHYMKSAEQGKPPKFGDCDAKAGKLESLAVQTQLLITWALETGDCVCNSMSTQPTSRYWQHLRCQCSKQGL